MNVRARYTRCEQHKELKICICLDRSSQSRERRSDRIDRQTDDFDLLEEFVDNKKTTEYYQTLTDGGEEKEGVQERKVICLLLSGDEEKEERGRKSHAENVKILFFFFRSDATKGKEEDKGVRGGTKDDNITMNKN